MKLWVLERQILYEQYDIEGNYSENTLFEVMGVFSTKEKAEVAKEEQLKRDGKDDYNTINHSCFITECDLDELRW